MFSHRDKFLFKYSRLELRKSRYLAVHIATLSTSVITTAAAVAAIYLAVRHLAASNTGALFVAVAYGLATPSWGWATTFFGHAMSGALLVLAFSAAILFLPHGGDPRKRPYLAFRAIGVGLLIGWAVVVEYSALPAAFMIGLFVIWRARALGLTACLQVTAAALFGAVVASAPLLIYNAALFGSMFELGYEHTVGFPGLKSGFYGIGLPQGWVLYEILVGARRGLLRLSPFLFLFPLAWIYLVRHGQRDVGLLVLGIGVSYVAINAGYAYWDGGGSTGPRHITAALPFLCIPFAWLVARGGLILRFATAGLLAGSVALACSAAVTGMTQGTSEPKVLSYIFSTLFEGKLTSITFVVLGLDPISALIVLIVIWIMAGVIMLYTNIRTAAFR